MLTLRPIKKKRRERLLLSWQYASAGGCQGESPLLYNPPQRVQVSCPPSLTLPQLSQCHGNEPVGGILSLTSCSKLERDPLYVLLLRSCVQTKDLLLRLRERTPDTCISQSQHETGRTLAQFFRAPLYADAVNRALPHATQVADRYHLVQNLREHLQQLLDRKRTCLPLVEDTSLTALKAGTTDSLGISCDLPPGESLVATPERAKAEGPDQPFHMAQPEQPLSLMEQEVELSSLTYAERKKKISRDKRYARYEEVMALHRAGIGLRAIARQLRISRKVVRRFVASPCFPERSEGTGQHHKKKSKLAPYLPYLRERWASGAHNGLQLFREIKDCGYTGSRALLGRLIAEWRTELPPKPRQGKPRKPRQVAKSGQRRLSSRSASFLMILPPEKLTVVQRQQLEHLCQASSDLHTVYLFSQEFVTMLKERQAESLHGWLKRVKESHVAELTSFANGISRDYAAVYAACSRPESNGVTEGHVNRLKFLKRQMFGRAHLDLLRVKVLHAI